jgi:hypothetical protein
VDDKSPCRDEPCPGFGTPPTTSHAEPKDVSPGKEKSMKTLIHTALAVCLGLVGYAQAQVDVYEYPDLGAYDYGVLGETEFGEFEEIDGYDQAEARFPYGNLALVTEGPAGQAIDIVITGPNGYSRTFESEAGAKLDIVELPLGTYSISATDDDLRLAHALVEVRLGEEQTLTFNMEPYQAEVGEEDDEAALEAGYFGVEEELGEDYEPFGFYEVEAYEDYEVEESGAVQLVVEGIDEEGEVFGYDEFGTDIEGHLVGPDDQRRDFGGESTTFEDLTPGIYSISATAFGYQLAQTFIEVQAHEEAIVALRLVGLEDELAADADGTFSDTGLFEDWDVTADSELTADEFETGVFGTVAGEDDVMSEDEFAEGAELFNYDEDFGFEAYDADADDQVMESEFGETFEASMFEAWDEDADSALTEEEYGLGLFGTLDADDDRALSEDELRPYSVWYGYDYGNLAGEDELVSEEEWRNADF